MDEQASLWVRPKVDLYEDWYCSVEFRCECGYGVLIIDRTNDEPVICPKCGKAYRLVAYIEETRYAEH